MEEMGEGGFDIEGEGEGGRGGGEEGRRGFRGGGRGGEKRPRGVKVFVVVGGLFFLATRTKTHFNTRKHCGIGLER